MQKWEYIARSELSDSELNALGGQGWELVAVTFYNSGAGRYFYLKRPK